MVRQRRVLGARMHGGVALAGSLRLRVLAGLVVGIGRHHHGAARLRRIGMIAIEVLELLGRVRVGAAVEVLVGVGVHLGRRIGVERFLGGVARGRAARRCKGGSDDEPLCDRPHAQRVPASPTCHTPVFPALRRFLCRSYLCSGAGTPSPPLSAIQALPYESACNQPPMRLSRSARSAHFAAKLWWCEGACRNPSRSRIGRVLRARSGRPHS